MLPAVERKDMKQEENQRCHRGETCSLGWASHTHGTHLFVKLVFLLFCLLGKKWGYSGCLGFMLTLPCSALQLGAFLEIA